MAVMHALVRQPSLAPERLTRIGIGGIWLTVAVLLLTALATLTAAQDPGAFRSIKGQWAFEVETPAGQIALAVALRGGGLGGVLITPTGPVEVEYRQAGEAFSITAELPASVSPIGTAATMVVRGTQIGENQATGTVLFIDDAPLATGATMFGETKGSFNAKRQ
jgi:hypothetical protein